MSKKFTGIEIKGLEPLQQAFKHLPAEFEASVVRNIARKPGNKVVSLARKLFTVKDTGVTKRTFGILRVRNKKQRFIEIGVKGRSLAWIFMKGAFDRKKKSGAKTGDIKPLGNVIKRAGQMLAGTVTKEMTIDFNKVIVQAWRKYRLRR
jgi:hypothetical protein